LGLLLILLSLMELDSVQVLLELAISGNAAGDSLLDVEALSRQVHLLLDKLNAALVDFTKFTRLVVLFLKDGGENVIGLLRSLLHLLLLQKTLCG
jgi:hypothetical protein